MNSTGKEEIITYFRLTEQEKRNLLLQKCGESAALSDDTTVSLERGSDYKYIVLSDGTAKITRYAGNKTEIYIPHYVDGKKVTSIGFKDVFKGLKKVQAIYIPNSVTSIEDWCFEACANLRSVTIPNSVKKIGAYAFYGCKCLTEVTIPNSVASIGDYAFAWCGSLTTVTIPTGVTSIGKSVFQWCRSLTTVTIPPSVASIGEKAFDESTKVIRNS